MIATTTTDDLAVENVAPAYTHYDKLIEPEDNIEVRGSSLKWYNVARAESPIPSEVRLLARSFLERESAALSERSGELGFVILHRCGEDFYFLIVATWRNENELWEAVYAKEDAKQLDFREFNFEGPDRGTFCVWELVAVWHERQAWRRYLLSERDDNARLTYLGDQYRGQA